MCCARLCLLLLLVLSLRCLDRASCCQCYFSLFSCFPAFPHFLLSHVCFLPHAAMCCFIASWFPCGVRIVDFSCVGGFPARNIIPGFLVFGFLAILCAAVDLSSHILSRMDAQVAMEDVCDANRAEVDSFLLQYEDSALFLICNLKERGCRLTEHPNSGNFRAVRDHGEIVCVFSLTRRG